VSCIVGSSAGPSSAPGGRCGQPGESTSHRERPVPAQGRPSDRGRRPDPHRRL